MAYVTTEERVDRLEAVFGQFMTEMAVINRRADERNKAADERLGRFEAEMSAFKDEMSAFKDEMSAFKDEMRAFKDEMRAFKDEMRGSKRELNQQWGALANKLGTIVEDVVAPNLRRLAVEHFRFPVIEDFIVRRSRRHGGGETEFDTIVVGPTAVVLGEAKSSPTRQSAEEFAAKAGRFFDFFPEYQGRRLIAVLGSWAMPGPVVERLTELGVYAMRMGEDTMELVNAAALEAKGRS
ncbi:MAG: hypothetical protein HS113_04205 [Verrucomicrobiales bacterium]|nr:hypothetical protein [Verrucomicrobiales bacterium]